VFVHLASQKKDVTFKYKEKIAVGKFDYPIIEADVALFIAEKFEIFIVQDFELLQIVIGSKHKAILSIDDVNNILNNQNSMELLLESKCCGFSAFTTSMAYTYANIIEPITDNSKFAEIILDLNSAHTNKLVEHTMLSLINIKKLYGDISTNSGASVREFISPVLVLAGLIAEKVSMKAEKRIVGSMGNGPLDYTYIYKHFDIAITEAKKDNIEAGVAQNIAQLVASREAFLFQHASEPANKNKRKYRDHVGDIADIPSTGIVTTGDKWLFLRYTTGADINNVFCNDILHISFAEDHEVIKKALLKVVGKLLGALKLQKELIDNNLLMKRICPNIDV